MRRTRRRESREVLRRLEKQDKEAAQLLAQVEQMGKVMLAKDEENKKKDEETKLLEDKDEETKKLLTEKDEQNQKKDKEAQRLKEKDKQMLSTSRGERREGGARSWRGCGRRLRRRRAWRCKDGKDGKD